MTVEELFNETVVKKGLRTRLVDILVGVVNGERDGGNKKSLAVDILKYVQQQRTAANNEIPDETLNEVFRLWHSDEPKYYGVTPCHLETVNERLVIVTPAPPAPVAVLAVPAPVLDHPDELQAVAHSHSQFTPERVAARVAAIEAVKLSKPTVKTVQEEMDERQDLQRRIEENEKTLARLRALRDANELAHELEDFGPVMKPSV